MDPPIQWRRSGGAAYLPDAPWRRGERYWRGWRRGIAWVFPSYSDAVRFGCDAVLSPHGDYIDPVRYTQLDLFGT